MIAALRRWRAARRTRFEAANRCSWCVEQNPIVPFGSSDYAEMFCSSRCQDAWERAVGYRPCRG